MALSRICKVLPRLVWGGLFVLCALTACMDDTEFTSSPTDRLAFSADTVRLDTVISGQATNTYTFEVYNPNEKAIRLPQVYLEQGAQSPFRVNVDGTYLEDGSASGFEIEAKDSLRVFLFASIEDSQTDEAVRATDNLVFVTEGGTAQKVNLEAYGQSVIPLRGLILTRDSLLEARRPYQVYDSLVVSRDARLTLAAGVRLYFHPGAQLIVHGSLQAEGTAASPVLFRGDRLGNMFSQQPYDRIPGQWGGIVFTGESYGNRMNFCDVHSGTFGVRCDSSDVSVEKLRLENSIVHNMSGDALTVRAANVFVGNSQITNAGGNCVTLLGGSSTFVHCTIGNFYAFSGGRGVALSFANCEGDIRLPLHRAAFLNCLITGYSTDEVLGTQSERYPNDPFAYSFRNCLLDTPAFEDERVSACLWDNDENAVFREDNFAPAFDLDRLVFTFGLNPASLAVDNADPEVTRTYYPNDRNGRDRLADGHPDIGCYELQKDDTAGESASTHP